MEQYFRGTSSKSNFDHISLISPWIMSSLAIRAARSGMFYCLAFVGNTQLIQTLDEHVSSLTDLEGYLMYKEYTVENLQFIVWYQDYRARYFIQSKDPRMSGVCSKELAFALPSSARAMHQIMGESIQAPSLVRSDAQSSPITETHTVGSNGSSGTLNSSTPQLLHQQNEQRLRHECNRVIATFFKPGAEKELSLDSNMRDGVLRELASNTHPDVVSKHSLAIATFRKTISRICETEFMIPSGPHTAASCVQRNLRDALNGVPPALPYRRKH